MSDWNGGHVDAAAYGLGVLDDPAQFEEHLMECARCRAAVAGFAPVAGSLALARRLGYLQPRRSSPRRKHTCCLLGRSVPGGGALLLLALGLATAVVLATAPGYRCAPAASAVSMLSPTGGVGFVCHRGPGG